MKNDDMQQQIDELREKLGSLRKERKDFWDKLSVIAGFLIPVAIAFAGYIFSNAQKEAEIRSNEKVGELQVQLAERQFESQQEISTINSKVGQVGLISNFFDALLSTEPTRKRLAISAVLIALPQEGPSLVRIVSESEQEGEIRAFAISTLESRRMELVQFLFSDSKPERLKAFNEIIAGWRDDPEMPEVLVSYGNKNPYNDNGVYNCLVTLANLNPAVLRPYKDEIMAYADRVESNGPKTKAQAEKLKTLLDES